MVLADEMNLVAGNAFLLQILNPAFLGDKQKIGDVVGENAIHFLRHRPVKRAQAGFHVSNDGATSFCVVGNPSRLSPRSRPAWS